MKSLHTGACSGCVHTSPCPPVSWPHSCYGHSATTVPGMQPHLALPPTTLSHRDVAAWGPGKKGLPNRPASLLLPMAHCSLPASCP